MAKLISTDIEIIGLRPGEKLYEELMTDEEKHRSVELDNFFSVASTFEKNKKAYFERYTSCNVNPVNLTYNSTNQTKKSVEEIEKLLAEYSLI